MADKSAGIDYAKIVDALHTVLLTSMQAKYNQSTTDKNLAVPNMTPNLVTPSKQIVDTYTKNLDGLDFGRGIRYTTPLGTAGSAIDGALDGDTIRAHYKTDNTDAEISARTNGDINLLWKGKF